MGGSPRGSAYSVHFARVWCRLLSLGISVAAKPVAASGRHPFSLYGSTRRRRLQVTAAAQWKDLMEALQRGFQGVQDACVDAVSLKPLPAAWFRLVASWPSGGTTWRQGTGETTPRSIGLSVRLQARPSGAVWLSG
jgi:hypothetical protein